MKITKQDRRNAKELFRSTFVNGVMDPGEVRTAVQQLIEKKPRNYIGMLEHFKRLVRLQEHRVTAQIESAVPLSGEQQAAASANLQRTYGRGLNISFRENRSLIGGICIRVGSDIYDGSIAGRLKQLQESI